MQPDRPSSGAPTVPLDPETAYILAVDSFYALDHLLSAMPPDEPLPAGKIAAMVRLIREARDIALTGGARPRAND